MDAAAAVQPGIDVGMAARQQASQRAGMGGGGGVKIDHSGDGGW